MSTISVRLPNSLHEQLRECAKEDGTSVNQFVSTAVAEKLSALLTEKYLEARAKRGRRKKFEAALKAVPDIEPAAQDLLPKRSTSRLSRQQS
jgi:uncharacterized protein (DUF1778 family)